MNKIGPFNCLRFHSKMLSSTICDHLLDDGKRLEDTNWIWLWDKLTNSKSLWSANVSSGSVINSLLLRSNSNIFDSPSKQRWITWQHPGLWLVSCLRNWYCHLNHLCLGTLQDWLHEYCCLKYWDIQYWMSFAMNHLQYCWCH